MLGWVFVLVFAAVTTGIAVSSLIRAPSSQPHSRYPLPLAIGAVVSVVAVGALIKPSLTGRVVGEILIVGLSALGALGALYPDHRLRRAFARGWFWDWAIPRWEVRLRCLVWAAIWALLAVLLR